MIIERYVNKDNKELVGGFVHLNKKYTEILYKGVYKLEFKHLYSILIVRLYDAGYIKEEVVAFAAYFVHDALGFTEDIEKLKSYLFTQEHYQPKEEHWKFFVNGFFGKLYNRHANIANIIAIYMHLFYEELLEQTDNILYIDTDTIYYKDSLPQELLEELGLEYIITPVDYLYFLKKKCFVCVDETGFKAKGMIRKSGIMKEHQEIISNIKRIILAEYRNKQINSILDEEN
jgi:hypothetical protein